MDTMIFCYPSTNSHHKSRSAGLEINSFWSHATWSKPCYRGKVDALWKRPTPPFLPFMDENWRTTRLSHHPQRKMDVKQSLFWCEFLLSIFNICPGGRNGTEEYPLFPNRVCPSLITDSSWRTIFRRQISSPLATNNVEHDHFENRATAGSSIFLSMLDSFLYKKG